MHKLILAVICSLVLSCSQRQPQHKEPPLARAYNKYLYPSELEGLINEKISPVDSAQIVSDYIDNWIRHNLILQIAEDNLQSAMGEINKQAEDYRESLVIYAYERQWLADNLDTIIEEDSMRAYFDQNEKDFMLKEDIYRLGYAMVSNSASATDSIYFWFSHGIEKYRLNLERYCVENCPEFSFHTNIWMSENDLFNLLPYKMYERGKFRTKGVVRYSDSARTYYAKIEDYYVAGSAGPYEYFKKDAYNIIMNKRKMQLLKNTYQGIYLDGLKRSNAEIFINK